MSGRPSLETQRLLLCGLHALNNAVQGDAAHWDKAELDALCDTLDPPVCGGWCLCWLNKHRHWLGLGDYDVNVLLCALESRGLVGSWWDARLGETRLRAELAEALPASGQPIMALLVNGGSGRQGGGRFGPRGGTNHWWAVRREGSAWWDLNSLARVPVKYMDLGELVNDLSGLLHAGGHVRVIRAQPPKEGGGAPPSSGAGKLSPLHTARAARGAAGATETPASPTLL